MRVQHLIMAEDDAKRNKTSAKREARKQTSIAEGERDLRAAAEQASRDATRLSTNAEARWERAKKGRDADWRKMNKSMDEMVNTLKVVCITNMCRLQVVSYEDRINDLEEDAQSSNQSWEIERQQWLHEKRVQNTQISKERCLKKSLTAQLQETRRDQACKAPAATRRVDSLQTENTALKVEITKLTLQVTKLGVHYFSTLCLCCSWSHKHLHCNVPRRSSRHRADQEERR